MLLDKRFLLGLLTILFCIALGYSAVDNYIVRYHTVSEVIAKPTIENIRVSGKLVGSPVIGNNSYNFQITDGNATLCVIYNGNLPSSFSIDSDVVVLGKMNDDKKFQATTVITKCPSKFEV
jgi:cytochrome c-type biogenesis protein CcmE